MFLKMILYHDGHHLLFDLYLSDFRHQKTVIQVYVFIPDFDKNSTKTEITHLGNVQCTASIIWF